MYRKALPSKLYVTMLGVCGTQQDAVMLEDILRSDDPHQKAGLDAVIACYLTLTGSKGLPLVEELFFKNPDAEYSDTYSAVMALRFHGNETEVLEKSDVVNAMRYVLDRPDMADVVIPDLARWEDWTVIPKLVEIYRAANDDSNWVRVPIVNFIRACRLPEAEEAMKTLREIDPGAVKRAEIFPLYNLASDGDDDVPEGATADSNNEDSQDLGRGASEEEVIGSSDVSAGKEADAVQLLD